MGGFQLFDRSAQPSQPITGEKDRIPQDIGSFVRILEIQDVLQHELGTIVPLITEAEIKDKGKSDGIGKFIVLLQTSWFIIQCIARGAEHLPLTELEVVTLAYAMMSLFIYIFWWDKPLGVGCPIRVYETLTTSSDTETGWQRGVFGIFKKILNYVLGSQDRLVVLSQERKVPMFWSGGTEGGDSVDFVTGRAALGPSILGIVFGAMHCIAWAYEFPSHAELVLWRASCVAMMVVPALSTVTSACSATKEPSISLILVFYLFLLSLILSAWLYIGARIATIVMAFTTLRSLLSEAFTVVDWTTFIPHV